MVHNFPQSSGMSPIPLFRKVTTESVSKGRSSLHKKLVQLFNQKTLVGSLISKNDRERMKKGKALLHIVGNKPTQCIALEAPTNVPAGHDARRSGEVEYKSGRPQTGGHSITRHQQLQTSTTSPTMSLAASTPSVASTPTSAMQKYHRERKQVTQICGVSFGGELKEARSLISTNLLVEEIFLDLLGDCEDTERLLDLHESIERGDLEDADEDAALWMPIVVQYARLLKAVFGRVSANMTKEQQGTKIRFLIRADSRFLRGLTEAEEKAQNALVGGGGERSAVASPLAGEKRSNTGASASCSKQLRRSLSSASLASTPADTVEDESSLTAISSIPNIALNIIADYVPDAEKEKTAISSIPDNAPNVIANSVLDVEKEKTATSTIPNNAPNVIADFVPDAEKEKRKVFENARKSMADYGRRISESAVRSEDLDSDGDDERTDRQCRFVDYPEGLGRPMVIGPVAPKTQEFIVVGPVPMDDTRAVAINKKLSSFAKAVNDGDKGSKALTAFSQHEIQKNFAAGESFNFFPFLPFLFHFIHFTPNIFRCSCFLTRCETQGQGIAKGHRPF